MLQDTDNQKFPPRRRMRQFKQEAKRNFLEGYGVKTWKITKTRNQVAVLLWLACWRLNEEDPRRVYDALKQQAWRLDHGQFPPCYGRCVYKENSD